MDPVAHTLFGAALAETGLKRLTRYAPAALIIGANIPDADAIVTVLGSDTSLYLRRGITHGVLAMVIWPVILWGLLLLWSKWRAGDEDVPIHRGWLLALSCLGTWSHPLLDWMNTYGVRLLMPFDGRWFYGDTLFIIDPWFWLLTASGVVMVSTRSRRALIGWVVLGFLASVLVLSTSMVAWGVKLGWILGVALIVGLRYRSRNPQFNEKAARFGVVTLLLYITTVYGVARLSEKSFEKDGLVEAHSGPIPGTPFEHRTILVFEDRYEVVSEEGNFEVPRLPPDRIVEAALKDPSIRGFSNWMRYPYWTVTETEDGYLVEFRDLRYVDPGKPPRGIGYAEVRLDKNLNPH